MKAIGYIEQKLGIGPEALVDLEVPAPVPGPRDLLVRVQAMAMNPRDTKMRGAQKATPDRPRILGWDAAGTVVQVGEQVRQFAVGDEVLYAGSILRQGANAQWQAVDERIVGKKPPGLSFAEAAALPAAGLTAYEMLFDRFGIVPGGGAGKSLLVVGGAGGVASIAIQLARQLTELQIIGTASRPESAAWVREMGAHVVISHAQDLLAQFNALELRPLDYAFSMRTTSSVWNALIDGAVAQGKIGFIDEPAPLDLSLLRGKSLSLHAEGLFTRSMHKTHDLARQGRILTELARLREQGILKSMVTSHLGCICTASLREAHQAMNGGQVRGKIVLDGFPDD